ncbi:sulfatase-like hydrolase/transferase [Vibrio sp. WJH972]
MSLHKNTFLVIFKLIGIIALLFLSDNYFFGERIDDLLKAHGVIYLGIFFSLWLLCFISLISFSFFSHFVIRLFATILFFSSTLISLSYLDISGISITYDSLYVLIENISFASKGIKHFSTEIASAVAISLFSLTLLLPPPKVTIKIKDRFFIGKVSYIFAILPFFILFAISWPRGGYGLEQTPIQYKLPVLASIIYFEKVVISSPKRLPVNEHISSTQVKRKNIILIVDESVRADYLDINKDQGITPYLVSQKHRFVNFGTAISGSNCSSASNQILRFGPNEDNFSQTYVTNPYIWQYAQNAGYKTVMLEGQMDDGQLNNGMKLKEKKYIDDYLSIQGKTSYDKDTNIAKLIKKYTSQESNKPVFIYAVKSGVHFPYRPLTPDNERLFKFKRKEKNKKERRILNYKNSIHYLTDSFFKNLLDGVSYKDTIIIYTSDHGQNLFDNGRSITHCSVESIVPYETTVPFIVFTDNKEELLNLANAAEFNRNKLSHFNIFPTLTKYFGYTEKNISPLHGMSLFHIRSERNKFVSGRLSENRLYQNGESSFDVTNKWNFTPNEISFD